FAKIDDHFIRWSARFGMARPDENAEANPGRRAGFDVAHSIPENRAASRIKREIRDGLQKHAGLGFAPRMVATVFVGAVNRVIRAVIDPGYRGVLRFKSIAHPSRQVRIGVFVEVATADAGLVSD